MKLLTKKNFAVIFFTFVLVSCKDTKTNEIVIKKAFEIGGPILFNEAAALAADSIKSYQKSEIDPSAKKTLEARLHDMEKKLEQLKQTESNSDEVKRIEAILSSVRPIIDSLDTRVSSLEDRVSLLERRIKIGQKDLPALRQEINYKNDNSVDKVQPSFDCSKAYSDIEVSICNSPELSDIDFRLGKIYKDLRKSLPAQASEDLQTEQIKWLKIRDSGCKASEIDCIFNVYNQRLIELSSKTRN